MTQAAETTTQTQMPSPIGRLTLVASAAGLRAVLFAGDSSDAPVMDGRRNSVLVAARTQLDEYFAGSRTSFDLSLDAEGTDFQRQAWAALCEIPYGETWTYGQQAAFMGRPTASRAVGAANGANPIPIIVPCHRVIGANGSLTGFAGGIESKRCLLEIETPAKSLLPPKVTRK